MPACRRPIWAAAAPPWPEMSSARGHGNRRRLRRAGRDPQGCRPRGRQGRDRRHRRAERGRQVDAAQDHRRAAAAEGRLRHSRRSRHHRRSCRARSPGWASPTCRRRTTSSPPCRCARTSRSAATSIRKRAGHRMDGVLGALSRAGAEAAPCRAHALGRRAADAGHGHGADGGAGRAPARRALGRPVAAGGRAPVRCHRRRSTATASPSPWSSRTPTRPSPSPSRLHPGRRPQQPHRRRQGACRRSRDPQAVPRRLTSAYVFSPISSERTSHDNDSTASRAQRRRRSHGCGRAADARQRPRRGAQIRHPDAADGGGRRRTGRAC